MKKIYCLFLFLFLSTLSFAESRDTSFTANLIDGEKANKIKISFNSVEREKAVMHIFTFTIDGIKYIDSTDGGIDEFTVLIMDIDKDDDYKEIVLQSFEEPEIYYNIFRYNSKKILNLGEARSMDELILKGDGILRATGWMGFWSYKYEYELNNKNKFEAKYKDTYDIKFEEGVPTLITVEEGFNLYKDKDKKSDVVVKLKKGDKFEFVKAFINIKNCENELKDLCFWYLLKKKNGDKGWIQLKDFQNKVTGIPWAG